MLCLVFFVVLTIVVNLDQISLSACIAGNEASVLLPAAGTDPPCLGLTLQINNTPHHHYDGGMET